MRILPAVVLALCGCDAVLRLQPVTTAKPDAAVPIAGLVAYYELETIELSGSRPCVSDSTSFHHDGICTGAPAVVPGHIGNALAFDGTSYVTIAGAPDLDSTAGLTVAMWINIPALPIAGFFCPVNRLYGDAAIGDNSWQICISNDPAYYFKAGPQAIFTNTPEPGAWHHVVLIWHPDELGAWLDGIHLQMTMQTSVAFDASPMTLGADLDNQVIDAAFVGSLDDVRIYNRELTADEIIALATM